MEGVHHEWTRAEIQDSVDKCGAQSSERCLAILTRRTATVRITSECH